MQNPLINAILNQPDTYTENGMVAYTSTSNECTNLFFTIGASRKLNDTIIINNFLKAFYENQEYALRILLWARDIRGGAGERRIFRIILKYLCINYSDLIIKNLESIPQVGRWDDLFEAMNTPVQNSMISYLISNLDNKLLCKWIPRKGIIFNEIRKTLQCTPKELRKKLVNNTQVVETQMCFNQWSDIKYASVPSNAMNRYKKAYSKRDKERFSVYLQNVLKGIETINSSSIYPHDIIKTIEFHNNDSNTAAIAQWNALPNYLENNKEKILPVCDVSGSMNGLPMLVCISLGLYISERNIGPFKDAFITFSSNPQLQYLSGNLINRYMQLKRSDWGMNTNLEATFKLILNAAVKNNIDVNDMPTVILIMSDMQFDQCSNFTAYEMMQNMYTAAGYVMPKIVFWNLKASDNVPVKFNQQGTALVSGFSPAILKSLLSGENMSPISIMLKTIMNDKYKINS